ncbi:alpha/beta-hydrolase [Russula dissimulans]|nr:alpha/beta-hydrolase [Russula dissimulans]
MAVGLFGNIQQFFNIGHRHATGPVDTQLIGFTPYIQFARAAYCNSNKIAEWKCGSACDALPGFIPTLTGGDGDRTQFFYVGYWPAESAVVIAHQGTDPSEFLAVLTDLEVRRVDLDPTLFPGLPTNAEVHSGFAIEHKKTARQILEEIERLMVEYSSMHVVIVGHSLGGALAELDSLFMKLNLPAETTLRGVTRANFFDSRVSNFTRINNNLDPVPIIPGRRLGFRHPSGEIHIQPDGSAVVCSGPDSVDPRCSNKVVQDIIEGDVDDHSGPYNDIFIGTQHCTT